MIFYFLFFNIFLFFFHMSLFHFQRISEKNPPSSNKIEKACSKLFESNFIHILFLNKSLRLFDNFIFRPLNGWKNLPPCWKNTPIINYSKSYDGKKRTLLNYLSNWLIIKYKRLYIKFWNKSKLQVILMDLINV